LWIPNYNLEKAHYENEIFQQVATITRGSSFKIIFLDLRDEKTTHKLTGFREYRKILGRAPPHRRLQVAKLTEVAPFCSSAT
jgi:hypothetical protein